MDRSRVSRCAALAGAFLVALAGTAPAQGPSRLDCAKAATPIERAICAKPELAAADRKMAAAYAALAGKLTGAAKDHLLADQIRWLANRAAACVVDPAEMEECLELRDRDRTAQLEWLGEGAYPFISEQAIVKTGKVRGIPYIIDASYPQFDAGTVDFSGVNRQLASAASEAGDRAVPVRTPTMTAATTRRRLALRAGLCASRAGPQHRLRQDRLRRLRRRRAWHRRRDRISSTCAPARRSDRKVCSCRHELAQGALAHRQRGRRHAQPRRRTEAQQRYVFLEDRLELSFDQYEGGPYAVEIPYDRFGRCCAPMDLCRDERIAGRSQRAVRQPTLRLCTVAVVPTPFGRAVSVGQVAWMPTRNRRTGRYWPSAREEPRHLAAALASFSASLDQIGALRLYIKQSHMGEGTAISAALRRSSATTRRARPRSASPVSPTSSS